MAIQGDHRHQNARIRARAVNTFIGIRSNDVERNSVEDRRHIRETLQVSKGMFSLEKNMLVFKLEEFGFWKRKYRSLVVVRENPVNVYT